MNSWLREPLSILSRWCLKISWVVVLLAMSGVQGCSQEQTEPSGSVGTVAVGNVPIDLQEGEQKFVANCSRCHGMGGRGTQQGPPLVHKIYEPNHHADAAFYNAAANGVRAHHWEFGNMPKIEGVTTSDIEQIVKYVRWLQKQAGIF